MPFIPLTSYQQPLDPDVYEWANTADYKNGDAKKILSEFVYNLKTFSSTSGSFIWDNTDLIFPMLTDKTTSTDTINQFKYSLKPSSLTSSIQLTAGVSVSSSVAGYRAIRTTANNLGSMWLLPVAGRNTDGLPALSSSYHIVYHHSTETAPNNELDFGANDTNNFYIQGTSFRTDGGVQEQYVRVSTSADVYYASPPSTAQKAGFFALGGTTAPANAGYWLSNNVYYRNTSYDPNSKPRIRIAIGAFNLSSTGYNFGFANCSNKFFQYVATGKALDEVTLKTYRVFCNDLQAKLNYALDVKQITGVTRTDPTS